MRTTDDEDSEDDTRSFNGYTSTVCVNFSQDDLRLATIPGQGQVSNIYLHILFLKLYYQRCNEMSLINQISLAIDLNLYILNLIKFAFINYHSKMPLKGCYQPFCKFANHLYKSKIKLKNINKWPVATFQGHFRGVIDKRKCSQNKKIQLFSLQPAIFFISLHP